MSWWLTPWRPGLQMCPPEPTVVARQTSIIKVGRSNTESHRDEALRTYVLAILFYVHTLLQPKEKVR
jgi:hypothetical protein